MHVSLIKYAQLHDIAEMLIKLALNANQSNMPVIMYSYVRNLCLLFQYDFLCSHQAFHKCSPRGSLEIWNEHFYSWLNYYKVNNAISGESLDFKSSSYMYIRAHQTRQSGWLLRLGFNEIVQFLSKSKVSVFSSLFFSPIIMLFLQYSHKRSSHVPEIWPI